MALLLELAEYSLSEFQSVPKGITSTSKFCQWVVPRETLQKVPVMETAVQKQPISKSLTSTIYNTRKADDRIINWGKVNTKRRSGRKKQ